MKRIFSILLVLTLLVGSTILMGSASAESYATVTSQNGYGVRLRQGPSKSYPVIAKYDVGTTVIVLQNGTEWSQIQVGSTVGWMMNEFLNFGVIGSGAVSSSAPVTGDTAIVISDNGLRVWLRSAPRGTRLFLNAAGTVVTVLEKGATWSHISINGTVGYMMTRYLSFGSAPTEPKELKSVELNYIAPAVGDVLSAIVLPEGASYTLSWAVETGAGTGIYTEESTEPTFTVVGDYADCRIRLTVTGTGSYAGKLVTYSKPVCGNGVVTGVKFGQTEPFTAGTTLTAITYPSSATVEYSWFVAGTVVSYEPTYTIQEGDAGKLIQLKVTGIGSFSGIAAASATASVVSGYELASLTLSNTQPVVGEVLTVTPNPANAAATYEWLVDGQTVAVNALSYRVLDEDLGKKITVKATAIAPFTGTAIASTEKVSSANLTSVTISNKTPMVGDDLTAIVSPSNATAEYKWMAVDGNAPSPLTFEYVWANSTIGGLEYTVDPGDKGKQIVVAAKGCDAFGGTALSTCTAAVPEEERTEVTVITISNTAPVVGDALDVSLGLDRNGNEIPIDLNGDTHSYLWTIGSKYVYDTTGHYVVSDEDVGKTIQVRLKIDNGTNYFCNENGIFSAKTEKVVASKDIKSVIIEIDDTGANAAKTAPALGNVLNAVTDPAEALDKVRYTWSIINDQTSTVIFSGKGASYASFDTASYPDCLGKNVKVTVSGTTDSYLGTKSATTLKVDPAFSGNELQALVLNITEPVIGDVIKVSNVPEKATASYVWFVDGQQAGTGASYTVKSTDLGKIVSVKGTATGAYTGEADAATSRVCTANVKSVSISDSEPHVGSVLTANVKPSAATVDCKWLVVADGTQSNYTVEDVWAAGTAGSSYTVAAADEGNRILVAVKGTGTYGSSALSAASGVVSGESRIKITGITINNANPVVDDDLTITLKPDDVSISSSDYTLMWIIGTKKVGADDYTVQPEDKGQTIQVQFTLDNDTDYYCAENGVFSVRTAKVVSTKELSGVSIYIKDSDKNAASTNPLVGQTLYAKVNPEAAEDGKVDYAWYVDGSLEGTSATFDITDPAWAGKKIKLVVEGNSTYYTGKATATTTLVKKAKDWTVAYSLDANVGFAPASSSTGTTNVLDKNGKYVKVTAKADWYMDSAFEIPAELDQFGTLKPATEYYVKLTVTAPDGYYRYGTDDTGITVSGGTVTDYDYTTGIATVKMTKTDSRLVTIYYITDIPKPVPGVAAVTSFENDQYSATVDWGSFIDGSENFIEAASYQATITVTAKSGYTFYSGADDGAYFTVSTASSTATKYNSNTVAEVNADFTYGMWNVKYNLKASLGSAPATSVTGTTNIHVSATDSTLVKIPGKVSWWMDDTCETAAVVDQYGNFKPGTTYYAKVEIAPPAGYVIYGLNGISDADSNAEYERNLASRYAIFKFTTDTQEITIYYITEIPKPVAGQPAVTEFSNDQYTATVNWTKGVASGKYTNVAEYEAKITITPKTGYELPVNATFTVSTADKTTTSGATVTATFTYEQELKLTSDYAQVDMNGTDNRIVHCFAELTHQDDVPADLVWVVSGRTSSATTMSEDGILTVGRDEAIGITLTVKATCKDSNSNEYKAELPIAVVSDGSYTGEIRVEFRNVPTVLAPEDKVTISAFAVNSSKGVTYEVHGKDSSTTIDAETGALEVGKNEDTNIVIVATSIEDNSQKASVFIAIMTASETEEEQEEQIAQENEDNEMNHLLLSPLSLRSLRGAKLVEIEPEAELSEDADAEAVIEEETAEAPAENAEEETELPEEAPAEEAVIEFLEEEPEAETEEPEAETEEPEAEAEEPVSVLDIEFFGGSEDDEEEAPVVTIGEEPETEETPEAHEAEEEEEKAEEKAPEKKTAVSIVLIDQDGTETELTALEITEEAPETYNPEKEEAKGVLKTAEESTVTIRFAAEELFVKPGDDENIEVSVSLTGEFADEAEQIASAGIWLELKGSSVPEGAAYSYIKNGVLFISEAEQSPVLYVIAHSNAYPVAATLTVNVEIAPAPASPAEQPAEKPAQEPVEEEEPVVEEPAETEQEPEAPAEEPAAEPEQKEEPAPEETFTQEQVEKEENIDPLSFL